LRTGTAARRRHSRRLRCDRALSCRCSKASLSRHVEQSRQLRTSTQRLRLVFAFAFVCGCGCGCVLSHWIHAAIVEVPNLPSLKCSSHWSLGLYPASETQVGVDSFLLAHTHPAHHDIENNTSSKYLCQHRHRHSPTLSPTATAFHPPSPNTATLPIDRSRSPPTHHYHSQHCHQAVKLREAMKGWGSDDKALLNILSTHSAAQRLQSTSP
jgi:hypothetical protein